MRITCKPSPEQVKANRAPNMFETTNMNGHYQLGLAPTRVSRPRVDVPTQATFIFLSVARLKSREGFFCNACVYVLDITSDLRTGSRCLLRTCHFSASREVPWPRTFAGQNRDSLNAGSERSSRVRSLCISKSRSERLYAFVVD